MVDTNSDINAAETSAASVNQPNIKSHNHRHSKKASDPFLEISDDALLNLPAQPFPSDDKNENGHGRSQSLLANIVLTPITMISFLLSWLMVDRKQRRWRLSQHASGQDSWSTLLNFASWLDPEPYQDSHARDKASADDRGTSYPTYPRWYVHKQHRAMAKLEINDAFTMQSRMVVYLTACLLFGLCAIAFAIRRLYAWIS